MTDSDGPRWVARTESQPRLPTAPRPPPVPSVLVIGGRIERGDISGIFGRARVLLEGCDAEVVDCDVGAIVDPDAVTVEALARLQLAARRLGRRVRFRHACGELEDLLAMMGLGEVLPCGPSSVIEARGQPEEREQALRVEEEADPGDPAF